MLKERDIAEHQEHFEYQLTETDKEDLRLYAEFVGGDDTAFIRLYSRYEAPLFYYCRKMCGEELIAEDSFQETWLRMFELRTKGVTLSVFRTFLFRTGRNACLNRMRTELVRRRGTTDTTIDAPELSVPFQSESEDNELRMLISTALGKLPIAEREVFVLHEYSGFSYADISVILGRSQTNIKTLAFRARTRLRKFVSGWLGLADNGDDSVFAQLRKGNYQ
jgi:RNA polymerase sigma-70 factor (ECF subfamily)